MVMKQIKYKGDCFYSFRDGVDIEDVEVQKMIDTVTKEIIDGKQEMHLTAMGNTVVFGIKYEDEAQIIVSKDYDEATILCEGGVWEPINYKTENKRASLEELSRSELINMLLKSDYNPHREV